MKTAAKIIGALFLAVGFGCFIAAIWTHGPTSQSLVGTAFVTAFTGALCAAGGWGA